MGDSFVLDLSFGCLFWKSNRKYPYSIAAHIVLGKSTSLWALHCLGILTGECRQSCHNEVSPSKKHNLAASIAWNIISFSLPSPIHHTHTTHAHAQLFSWFSHHSKIYTFVLSLQSCFLFFHVNRLLVVLAWKISDLQKA